MNTKQKSNESPLRKIWQRFATATPTQIILAVAFLVVVFGNRTFAAQVTQIYQLSTGNAFFLFTVFTALFVVTVLLLSLIAVRRLLKPILIAVLLLTSVNSYFMDSYHVVIDK